jgi:hypothetical protein
MARFHVLLTDYAWPDLNIEREILAGIDAELVVAEKGKQDAASLAELAKGKEVDAIMTNWAKVPRARAGVVAFTFPQNRFLSPGNQGRPVSVAIRPQAAAD